MPLHGFSLALKGKEIILCSVDLSSLAPRVSDIITPSSCAEVSCLMVLASYFSPPSSRCLIDPFKEGLRPLCVSLDFYHHGTSFFLCWVQGWIVRLEHKMLFHGTPAMYLWMPCYAWTTDADMQRDTRAASEEGQLTEALRVLQMCPLFLALPSCYQASHRTEHPLTKTVSI